MQYQTQPDHISQLYVMRHYNSWYGSAQFSAFLPDPTCIR